jgi:hypothetical protein
MDRRSRTALRHGHGGLIENMSPKTNTEGHHQWIEITVVSRFLTDPQSRQILIPWFPLPVTSISHFST